MFTVATCAAGSLGDGPPRASPLSPGLLQHIQAVKDNPQALHSSHRTDLAGWGPGPLSPMPASPAYHHHVQVRPLRCSSG